MVWYLLLLFTYITWPSRYFTFFYLLFSLLIISLNPGRELPRSYLFSFLRLIYVNSFPFCIFDLVFYYLITISFPYSIILNQRPAHVLFVVFLKFRFDRSSGDSQISFLKIFLKGSEPPASKYVFVIVLWSLLGALVRSIEYSVHLHVLAKCSAPT